MVFGLVQIATAFGRYQHISKIAYEVARIGTSSQSLEICSINCAQLPGHSALITRAQSLLQAQGFVPSEIEIHTQRTANTIGDFGSNAVLIEITANNQNLVIGPGLSVPAVHARVKAPYIY